MAAKTGMMRHMRTRNRQLVWLVGFAAIAAVATMVWLNLDPLPKRFGVVVPGRLYRCGDLSPDEMARVTEEYKPRVVLSLLDPEAPETKRERAAAEQLGLRWENVPLRGDGSSTPEDRERIKEVLLDPDAAPLLVHCAAGANRTGLAIGLYRIREQGWTPEQVLAEMREYGFEDLSKHENLRQALRDEWRAVQSESSPTTAPVAP